VSVGNSVRIILVILVFLVGALAFLMSAADMNFDRPPICEAGGTVKLFANCREEMKHPAVRRFDDDFKEFSPNPPVHSAGAPR
jgi:hypothetical protein